MPKLNYTSTGSSTNNPSSSGWTCSPSPSGSSGVCSKNDYSASFNYVCSGQGSHGGWDACQVDSSTSGNQNIAGSSGSGLNIPDSHPTRHHHSSDMRMVQEHHARFVEQSKLKALSTLKQHGEEYTLPYDDQGNRLSTDEFIKKADGFLGARIKTSTSPSSKKIDQEKFDHVEHRKKLLDNINKHFESPFVHSPVTIPFISIEKFKPFANSNPQEPKVKPLLQLEKYSQINKDLGLASRKQAVSDVVKSYNPLQLLNQNESSSPFQKKEQPQDISEQQLKLFDGGLHKFISNLEEMDKSGNAQDEVLRTIHFTHSREATRYCSSKEPGSKPQHGVGFWGVKVPIPLNDQDISKIIPYLPRFSLDYLCINNSKITDLGIATLMQTTLQVKTLNLSDNNLGDDAAIIISNAIANGQLPATKYVNLSGNKITPIGEKYLADLLKAGRSQDIAITLEVHTGKNAVIDFLKKGSSYYFKEFVKRFNNNMDTQYIKTDEDSAFMHCKEGVPKAVVGVTLGIAKCTNPIAKIINSLPQPGEKVPFVTKAVNKLGLFACVMSEEGDNIITPDLIGCIAEGNEWFNND